MTPTYVLPDFVARPIVIADRQNRDILRSGFGWGGNEQGKRILSMNALIPQPLLPKREKGSKILRIKVPLPAWERDLG
jgi:hypothetical protein